MKITRNIKLTTTKNKDFQEAKTTEDKLFADFLTNNYLNIVELD